MDTTALDPLIGQLLDSRYRIDARIAVGGMATVYRAVDTRLDRVLALKVMHPSLAVDEAFVERFIREAKAAARLAHPNVVGVFDQGTDGTYVYLAMEYVAGCTLRDVLRERGALQPRAALDILEPVLAALGAAHRAGLVHRDMKPENVLIGDDGRVKVADFGLARAVDTHTQTTGSVLGTVSYMAPEQIEHGAADTRVDVYACGMTLYEMLTGGKPHAGGTPAQVIYQHLHEDVPPPSEAVPGLAAELDELVTRATARDPEQRPRDAVELLAQVRTARQALTDEQLDAEPPRTAPDDGTPIGSEDRTRVVPRPATSEVSVAPVGQPSPGAGDAGQEPLNRTSRLELPPSDAPDGPDGPAGPLPRLVATLRAHRRVVALVSAALLALCLLAGMWYVSYGRYTQVPAVLSKTEQEARRALSDAGLEVTVEREHHLRVPRGKVIATEPGPGERVRDGDTVTLLVSLGPERVKVPELAGEPLAEARQRLKDLGLVPGEVTRAFHPDVPRGSVIRTDPGPGELRRPNESVDLVVSRGARVLVPDVTGEEPSEARATLAELGLRVRFAERRVHSLEDAGTVAQQSVPAGEYAGRGETITLTLSKGPDMVEVPDVEGLHRDKAAEILEEAGFEVEVKSFTFGLLGNKVYAQSPGGGEKAPRGSTVTIRVR